MIYFKHAWFKQEAKTTNPVITGTFSSSCPIGNSAVWEDNTGFWNQRPLAKWGELSWPRKRSWLGKAGWLRQLFKTTGKTIGHHGRSAAPPCSLPRDTWPDWWRSAQRSTKRSVSILRLSILWISQTKRRKPCWAHRIFRTHPISVRWSRSWEDRSALITWPSYLHPKYYRTVKIICIWAPLCQISPHGKRKSSRWL